MTRRGRLTRLEARRRENGALFEADPGAGLWREVGGQGRTLLLSPEDLHGEGRACAYFGPGGTKIYPGLSWGDL